jgi:predicted nucleic acid-binding Zn ribbon protein
MTEQPPEHVAVWLRFRRVFGNGTARAAAARAKKQPAQPRSVPFGDGRDPLGLGEAIDGLSAKLGWSSPLAKSELLLGWPEIVGAETALHAAPVGIEDGVLTVRCDSTAWAQQLRLMKTQVTTQIAKQHPEAGVESVVFLGPDAPSWKRGPRSIPGRGPRDTYG